ncbi:MAG: ion transporter [Acidobacteriota bacterium]|nr:ion transporter [Acidobacteriota bacterium]
MQVEEKATKQALNQERYEVLQRLEDWLETPMLVLGFVWLALLVVEFTWGLSPLLETAGTVIWIIFIVDFGVKLLLAPHKLAYLKSNWLTVIALLVPALRVFRIVRVVRLLRVARAARGLRMVRVVTSLNRGMKALGSSLGRRGFGYVLGLSGLVTFAGAAGMFAFEKEVPTGFKTYGEALWWTAMLLTSIGSEYWPHTGEGRVLCFLLSLYGFAVFGYVTATLATFFVGRDAENEEAELAGAKSIENLSAEIAALRAEIRALNKHQTNDTQASTAPAGDASTSTNFHQKDNAQ